MAVRSLATVTSSSRMAHYRVYLHLDTDGAWVSGGHAIPLRLLGRFVSDGVVQPVWETEGKPVSVGRAMRILPDRARRLVMDRDRGCRFPGCTNGRYVDAHHVHFWEDGGETNLANLVSLCHRHHRLLHQGDFRITADGHQHFTFHDRWGDPIGGRKDRPPGAPPGPAPGTTRARSGGNPEYSIDLAVCALAG